MRRPTAMLAATAACVLAGVVRAEAEAGHMMMMDKVCWLTHFFLVLNFRGELKPVRYQVGSAQELGSSISESMYVRQGLYISLLQHVPGEVEGPSSVLSQFKSPWDAHERRSFWMERVHLSFPKRDHWFASHDRLANAFLPIFNFLFFCDLPK